MVKSLNYYEILGVTKSCSNETIKKAYRKLSKKYHPDSQIEPNVEKFRLVLHAYQVLIDSKRRKAYDSSDRPKTEKVFSTGFYKPPRGNFRPNLQVNIRCTIEQMMSSAFFHVKGYSFSFPGAYTNYMLYQTDMGVLEVNFELLNNKSSCGRFTFIPNLEGMCCTIVNKPVVTQTTPTCNSLFTIDTPVYGSINDVKPDIVDSNENNLVFFNLGYTFVQPITDRILQSILIIPYENNEELSTKNNKTKEK